MEIRYMISADFGQTYDYTAVAVTERRLVPVGERYQHAEEWADWAYGPVKRRLEVRQKVEQHYDLIRLDRVPLRTPYTKIAKGLVTLLQEFYRAHTEADDYIATERVSVGLAIDEGGVGKAVRDILIKEVEEGVERGKPHVRFLPVTVHGGAKTTTGGGFYHVPKRDLVSAGLVTFQNGRLRVGNLRHRHVLEKELTNYRLKQNIATGNVAFEPLREGEHDDLVFAVCLGAGRGSGAPRRRSTSDSPPRSSARGSRRKQPTRAAARPLGVAPPLVDA